MQIDDVKVVKSTVIVHSSQPGGQGRLDSPLETKPRKRKEGRAKGSVKDPARKINPTEFKGMKGNY